MYTPFMGNPRVYPLCDFVGKFDLNVLIIEQGNFTFNQERGFTKGKTAVRS